MKANSPKQLLIIEDDPVFADTLAKSLRRKNLSVAIASESSIALEQLEQTAFDLVLLDLNLNGESGLQLLTQIVERWPKRRVIMVTAYASVATAVEAIKRGAEDYLCKPITSSDIMAVLNDSSEEAQQPAINENPLSVDRLEWEHLQRVLLEHNGNISATARALNMHRRTLQRKLQKRPVAK